MSALSSETPGFGLEEFDSCNSGLGDERNKLLKSLSIVGSRGEATPILNMPYSPIKTLASLRLWELTKRRELR